MPSSKFDLEYKRLNKEQKRAVDAIDGPLLVIAGPGSGKTQILSLRVGNILKSTDTRPSNILCLTFTDSAAINMKERLADLIGPEAYRVGIYTFHNFCTDIIGRFPEFFYNGALFAPADPISQISILEEIFDSLPHENPLRSIHPEQGFVYLSPVLRAIGHLKKGGLTPGEFKKILSHNKVSFEIINKILGPVFDARLSKSNFGEIEKAISELEKESTEFEKKNPFPSFFFPTLISTVIISLKDAYERSVESESTKPLSSFKEKIMKKDDGGRRVIRDEISFSKMEAFADIYERYQNEMEKRGFFDFDDMILDVIAAFEKHPRLRYELQEQYQYFLVDEFQDTNGAQMRLLELLLDADVNEGRPNVMVVGDDDQAVYKFQGAELSNMLEFRKRYRDVEMVTMTKNYRSTQDILDIASHIIRKGENRLENIIPEIEKTLVASHPDIEKGGINHLKFKSSLHEYHFVAREIKRLLDDGHVPDEIAVIGRKHRELQELVSYLQVAGVPIRYERQQNVFLEPHIREIILIARFIASLNRKDVEEADEYLPEILSFPFWNIKREVIWKISIEAAKGEMVGDEWRKKQWLEILLHHKDKNVKAVGCFLLELAAAAGHEPLSKVIDMIIGAHVVLLNESEDEEDDQENEQSEQNENIEEITSSEFISPFKDYYFNKEKFEHARTEYLSFLSSLRVFIRTLREYREGEQLALSDLVEFVDLHEKNNIALNDQSPFAAGTEAVSLLTAHKAKGLEFNTVFVLSCQDDVWAPKNRGNKLTLPSNLPIEPAGDTLDDQLRLFYVALTRAKCNLYLTSYEIEEDGENSPRLRFLLPDENDGENMKNETLRKLYLNDPDERDDEVPETHELLTSSWLKYNTPPFFGEEESLLRILLENYKLSVTHLNNFLNVKKGGPRVFLEQNLLRFPQSKTPSGAYGSAIHRALEKLSIEFRRTGKLLSEEEFLKWFVEYLKRERLSDSDFKLYSDRGKSALEIFYDTKKDTFIDKDKTEVNFKDQGVLIGKAELTGKIDRIVDLEGGEFEVHDYKTGKAKDKWEGKDDYEKIKLYEYERQLIFYKILVENSKDYNFKKVNRGVLEFVEPIKLNGEKVQIDLPLEIENEKVSRTKALIEVVYNKIMNLDFPDVSNYSPDLEGIKAFEDDLLK